jgi:hypothetical protein
MAQKETIIKDASAISRNRKDSPFLRIPDVCGTLATGVSDVTVDIIAVYRMMVDKRILFWRCKCSSLRNPTSLGSGLSRLAEGTKHGHHDLESVTFITSITIIIYRQTSCCPSGAAAPSPRRADQGTLNT